MDTELSLNDSSLERLPPPSMEEEQAVLGALLVSGDGMSRIVDILEPDYFYRKAHQIIYAAGMDLFDKNEPIDIITISQFLKDSGQLEQVGGRQYITDLSLSVATTANLEYYAKVVQEKALLRHLIKAGTEIVSSCYDETDAEVAIDKAEHLIFGLAQRRNLAQLVHIKNIVETSFAKIEERYENRDSLSGVPTGFYDLDAMTSGFSPSDLVIIAARPSMGKTAFVLNIAQHCAVEANVPVAIFSLEMSKEQLVMRMLCSEANIDANRLRSGHMHTNDWTHLAVAMGRLGEAPIFIDDSAMLTALDIRAKCRRLKAEHKGLGMVIIDYIQLMQGRRADSNNRVQEVSEISRSLKTLAREIGVPVVALSQLSRAVEARQNKRPMLSDLRESGCLTGDSLVFLPDTGSYARMDSLLDQRNFNVMALDPITWKLAPKRVTNVFATGNKPVFKIKTRSNRQITATANHKFLTIDGWKRLDELTSGVHLATPRTLPNTSTQSMTDSELGLLGLLIGDGCTLANHVIQYTTADRDLADLAKELATQVFGEQVSPRVNKEQNWYQVYMPASFPLTHNKQTPVAAWLRAMDVFDLRSYEKRIPDSVFAQPKAALANFIKHLWATDGTIHISDSRKSPSLFYATSSVTLANGLRSLLLRFGINATIRQVPQPNKGRNMFNVDISGKPDVSVFLSEIGILGERKLDMARKVKEYLSSIVANTNRDVLPKSTWRSVVEPARVLAGVSARDMQSKLSMSYCGSSIFKTNISRERATRVATIVKSEELLNMAASDVYWDEIVDITPSGTAEVYDLTVDDLHNFVVNDMIAHNSIEQDADIVMFIYRDEYYNQESDKRGEAEVIIAKQRNGPVGTVDLLYQSSITRFLNKVHNQYTTA